MDGSWRYHRLRSRQHKACSQNIPNLGDGMVLSLPERTQATVQAVSYTHLDVYKRQAYNHFVGAMEEFYRICNDDNAREKHYVDILF